MQSMSLQRPCLASRPVRPGGRRTVVVARNSTSAIIAATAAASLLLSSSALAAELPFQAVFDMKCAGCHMNGGNVVQPGATLFEEDLAKNGVSTPDELYKIIYAGKGKMPGYGTDCAPRGQCTFGARLSDEEVQGLVSFVQQKAATKWQ